jgi:hypothetical protein
MTETITLAGYAVIVGAMVVVQLVAFTTGRISTWSQALATVRLYGPARLAVLAFWLWLGWHVFVRSTPGA